MSVQHFKSLLFRSLRIRKEIDKERLSRMPNALRLLKLKKLHLVIQAQLKRMTATVPSPQFH